MMGPRLTHSDYNKQMTSAAEESKGKETSENKQPIEQSSDIDKKQLEVVVSMFNDFLEPVWTNLKFELHDRLDRYYVSVIDSATDEVIKEIPPKKMLDMYADMAEFMGFLIDEKI